MLDSRLFEKPMSLKVHHRYVNIYCRFATLLSDEDSMPVGSLILFNTFTPKNKYFMLSGNDNLKIIITEELQLFRSGVSNAPSNKK